MPRSQRIPLRRTAKFVFVAATIMRARKGDQVHLKGWLVSYGQKGTPYRRMTSTTRNDRGNGACETIFINEFEILREANPGWRALYKLSLGLMAFSAGFLVFAPDRRTARIP
jgi:hypothetical protein